MYSQCNIQWQTDEVGVFYVDQDCNACGCEYGRRETLVRCCSNYGPLSSMAASAWRVVAAFPVYVYSQ